MNFLNEYSIIAFLSAVTISYLGIFIFLSNPTRKINIIFCIYSLSIAFWTLCQGFLFACQSFGTRGIAELLAKTQHIGVFFLPTLFLHSTLIAVKNEQKSHLLKTAYTISLLFTIILPTSLFIKGMQPLGKFTNIVVVGKLYPALVIFFVACVTTSFYYLYHAVKKSSGKQKKQLSYLFWGSIIGYVGGSLNFAWPLGFDLYPYNPYGTLAIPVYILIIVYAIFKYNFMDIKFAITSTGIFLTIYAVVLGVPFWLGFGKQQWMYSLLSMGVLATAGPFIYGKLKQQAERKILSKQIEYQHALRSLAKTITQVKDLDTLFDHIVTNVYDLVKPEYAAVYTISKAQKAYMLKIQRSFEHPMVADRFAIDSILAQALNHDKKAIFSELINDPAVNETMVETILVPFFAEEKLYGIMTVGAKVDKSLYGQGDIEVFDILSSEMSIAVENLLFWREEKSRIMREEQIRRQKAMDNFSASLAHEIDNPIFSVQCAIDALKHDIQTTAKGLMPEEKLSEIITTLTDIGQSTRRISKIIKAIREFSGQNTGEMKALSMDAVADNLISIVGPQIKHENIIFNINITQDLFVNGNKIHLIELLMNLTSNSIHAVKNNGLIEKKINLAVMRNSDSTCLVEVSDNGYGIEPDLIEDIFLDFVTTKPSGEGSGMGLARCRKIAENHHGKLWAQSQGKGKGAAFFVELPLLK